MRLLSGPISLFTAKVRIALDEKGILYERVEVPFSRATSYEPKHHDVLALNPRRQVPVLVEDDGFAVYDSTLILHYLEERSPERPLLPAGVRERAVCRQLEAAADEELFPHVWTLIQQRFYQPDPTKQDAAAVDEAVAAIRTHVAALAPRLAGGPWLCGDAFTIADIGYVLVIDFAENLGVSLDGLPGPVTAWLERVRARPAVAREREGLQASAARIMAESLAA